MRQRLPNIGVLRESGTITLWMLGLCLMLFLLGGISLDLWRAFSERRSLAASADAAAVAGASALDEAAYRSTGAVRLVPADAQRRARASLAKLRSLEAGLALPGHGEPWTGGLPEALRLVEATPFP